MNELNRLANINKVLETDNMRIDKNIIKIRGRTFQISNISSISVYDVDKVKYPEWAIILLFIGIVVLLANPIIGMLLAVIGGIGLGLVYKENSVSKLRLTLWMNNGEAYSVTSTNIEFLYKVASAIEYCMNESNGYCQIDFKANDITNCNFTIGEYNSVN
ncbi:DUF6232 family protein [Thomasclavelia cocleata]|jgi:hypothetical protein|uniref:DUF6232 family protein n=1 Tax=Thomasclavelia cocleata TaxID=69824 RepID=UPI00241D1020|nr:DUF6232 family protein [Thomasclavelia cocleata]